MMTAGSNDLMIDGKESPPLKFLTASQEEVKFALCHPKTVVTDTSLLELISMTIDSVIALVSGGMQFSLPVLFYSVDNNFSGLA